MNNAVKERPLLQFSVNCDGVGQDESGKLVLVGIFEFFKQPATVPQFFIVNRWTRGSGTFKQNVRILRPDRDLLVEAEEVEFTLSHPTARHTIASGFVNQNFPDPGVYWVEVSLDDELELAWPLLVLPPASAG